MEWTKIPIDLLQSRKSDKEILAITKYQLLWAMLERKPDDDTALRYLTKKQLQIANDFMLSIEQCVCNDIKSVINSRKRQKNFYEKNQTVKENSNGKTNCMTNCNTNSLSLKADKIREDNIRKDKENKKENKQENLNKYGEFKNVCLTEDYYEKLKATFGEEKLNKAIEKLDAWLDNPKQSKQRNHNHRGYFKSDSWVWEQKSPSNVGGNPVVEHNLDWI